MISPTTADGVVRRARAIADSRLPRLQKSVAAALILICGASVAEAATLRGSRPSLHKQNRVAKKNNYSYLRNGTEVQRFVSAGYLVRVPGNGNYQLAGVSYPYARPEVKLFVERLGAQYRSACGEPLVVTSLTRPKSAQPRNASHLSVHPTGMALDLRMSRNSRCRSWLESVLLSLEKSAVLDATKERKPPHYHVALYPEQYTRYVARRGGSVPSSVGRSAAKSSTAAYRVKKGDTLWDIARRAGTSVAGLARLNGLRSNAIRPGQVLKLP